ncbi:MAG: protein kinase, partial [Calditrichia bacterium]
MGSTLGTVAYMSPEQISGKEVDQRTDLWSFGVVIFEMITGRLPFLGDYDQAIFYSIMNEPPEPLTGLRTGVPMSLEWIVNKLLAKDPAERYQNANDLIIDLKAVDLNTSGFSRTSSSSTTGMPATHRSVTAQTPPETTTVSKRKSIIPYFLAALLLGALLVISLFFFTQPEPKIQTIRTSITTLNSDIPAFTTGDLEGGHFALSPDGTLLAYVAEDSTGKSHLWVRRLDALSAQKLSGTEGASYPFWSADNRFIAFFTSGKLKKINAAGGPALTICEAKNGRSGTWNNDNIILFAPDQVGELFQVAAGGDSAKNERTHRWPFFLPDGNHFLYFARHSGTSDLENDAIYVSALDGSVNKVILNARTNMAYANNYILYVRDNTLMARRFDPGKLEFIGDARPIAENLKYTSIYSKGAFTVSRNGLLIYQSGTASSGQNLIWYDQKGRPGNTIGAVEAYRWVNISPDQKKATISIYDAESRQEDLWIHDFSRDIRTRFTFDQAYERMAVWSPDNQTIVFNSNRGGKSYDLYRKNATGSGETTLLFKDSVDKYPTDWTTNGRFITYTTVNTPNTKWDLWILPMDSDQKNTPRKPYPFLNTKFSEGAARFSPDGKWIAYFSDESGQDEIYVRPFPGPGGKWQISTAGGYDPYWREDGREIYYPSNDNKMMAVGVKATNEIFEVGSARVLF